MVLPDIDPLFYPIVPTGAAVMVNPDPRDKPDRFLHSLLID